MDKLARYNKELISLETLGNLRGLPEENNGLIDLCSNDYLGLCSDSKLYNDFIGENEKYNFRFGSASSRLLSGKLQAHSQLENEIAGTYSAEACLVFNSGYHANIGIISALTNKNDLIIADKFIHASLIDGAMLSKAKFMRFKHLNYKHLEVLVKKHRGEFENVFILSESVFSMDGDKADLEKLVEIKTRYNCFLYFDEAHSIGVRGKNGLGCAEESGLLSHIDLLVGTFGKALASIGAFVVCNKILKDYLVNHARSLIYSTALPPINIEWTRYIFRKLPEFRDKRKALDKLISHFASLINRQSQSHILPYLIGENKEAIEISEEFRKQGFNVLPIRYPTVPKGTARLRFSLRADMNIEQLEPIKNIVNKYDKKLDN